MPNDQQQPQPREKRKLLQYLLVNAFKGILNFLAGLPGIRNLPGVGKFTYEARAAGKYTEEEIRKELRPLFDLNMDKITELKQIEVEWDLLDKIVFRGAKVGEQQLPALVNVYREIGIYTDVGLAQTETTSFEYGTYEIERSIIRIVIKTDEKEIMLPRIKFNDVKLIWEKFGSSIFHEEDLYAFGHAKINELRGYISTLRPTVELVGTTMQPFVDVRAFTLNLVDRLNEVLEEIQKIEVEHFHYISGLIPQINRIPGIKSVVNQHRPDPKKIRFSHSYKIIKPVILVDITEKVKKIVNGNIVEEEITSKKPIYFNPIKNPYTYELEEVSIKIDEIKGDEIEREKSKLENNLRGYEEILKKLNQRLNHLKSASKNGILEDLYIIFVNARINPREASPREFFSRLSAQIDIIFNASQEKVEEEIKNLISFLRKKLEEIKVARGEIDKIVQKIQKALEFALFSNQRKEIDSKLASYNASILNIKNRIDMFNSELIKRQLLLFRKQQLEFYIRTLKPNHPNFTKGGDEAEYGLDENGYPLEVDPETGEILMDRWWKELSEHHTKWHEKIVKSEPGGEEVWETKVTNGVKKDGIRKIDKRFVADLDALDMAMFIYNEWDSYRDDFRDGRYHPYSKTIMDYLMASNNGIIPDKPIDIHFDPTILPTNKDYITFEPIKKEQLPADEQKVTPEYYTMRIFNTVTNQFEPKAGIRKPTHLNPAFDRAALHKGILHWGRMYYYETPDGIKRWSKNPFPHVSTRGLAKYLIDKTIRGTYKFEEARNALKGIEWDYGRRHYTTLEPEVSAGPYITDPLGEGGVTP